MADLEAGLHGASPRSERSSPAAVSPEHRAELPEPPATDLEAGLPHGSGTGAAPQERRAELAEPPTRGAGEGAPAAADMSPGARSSWARRNTGFRSFFSSASGVLYMCGHQGGSAGDLHVRGKATTLAEVKEKKLSCRGKGRLFLLSVEFQVFMTLVILVDVGAFVFEELTIDQDDARPAWTFYINIITLSLYTLEIIAKLICFHVHGFFRDIWNVFDLIIVILSAVLFEGPGGAVVAAKLTKAAFRSLKAIVKMFRVALRLKPMSQAAKSKVSKNKFRYVDAENNLNLDLTYIDRDLVAMGVPTVGFFNTFVRNSLHDVARFFKINHRGHFRVYNACPEMLYPEAPFKKAGGSMTCFQIQDHSPPRMEQFLTFLRDAREFRSESHDNVIAVHCKAGKGRTGSLCCAWLLYAKKQKTAERALEMFAQRRTDTRIGTKLRGVETPSQIRYVNQLFEHLKRTDSWLHSPAPPPPVPTPTVTLHRLTIEGAFFAHPEKVKGVRVLIQCFEGCNNMTEPVLETEAFAPSEESVSLTDVVVKGDVRVALFADKGKGYSARDAMLAAPTNFNKAKGLLAYFCFHTGFMYAEGEAPSSSSSACGSTLEVDVSEMDKASKRIKTEKRDGRFNEGSQVVLHFSGGHVPPYDAGCRSGTPRSAAEPRLQRTAWNRTVSSYASVGSTSTKDDTNGVTSLQDKVGCEPGGESGASDQACAVTLPDNAAAPDQVQHHGVKHRVN